MDKIELEKYKADLIQQCEVEIGAVKNKFERRVQAVEVLLEDSVDSSNGGSRVLLDDATPEPKNLATATRASIMVINGNFTSPLLFDHIKKHFPLVKVKSPADVSAPLWGMKRDGEIEVIKQGAGRSPSIYKKTPKFKDLV